MRYWDADGIMKLHDMIVKHYGGRSGTHQIGQIESLLHHIQNDEYYPTCAMKAAHLFFGLVQFHCFVDGNKRTAVSATFLFLQANGYELSEAGTGAFKIIALLLARGKLSQEEVKELLTDEIGVA
jgi:death on curing protein